MPKNAHCIVLDVETARSADDCRHCGKGKQAHRWNVLVGGQPAMPRCYAGSTEPQFTPLGWDNPPSLGLSIGCYYDYRENNMHWFDIHTLQATIESFVVSKPLLVSFNGIAFDFILMEGLLSQQAETIHVNDSPSGQEARPMDHAEDRAGALLDLCDVFHDLYVNSYDILAEIWRVDPARKFERGLNSLGVLAQANGYGTKAMDGAMAPRLWAQGRYAEVLNYCQGDVLKTKQLFEQILTTGQVLRGDGLPIALPPPVFSARG